MVAKRSSSRTAPKRYLAKPLEFPKIRAFSELFEQAEPWSEAKGRRLAVRWNGTDWASGKKAWSTIGPYLTIRDNPRRSMAVKPQPWLVEWIKTNLLFIEYDTLHFEIVIWTKREALVIVSYGKIIGSRWLAIIDPKTIPNPAQIAAHADAR
jgi:hypothetical protein